MHLRKQLIGNKLKSTRDQLHVQSSSTDPNISSNIHIILHCIASACGIDIGHTGMSKVTENKSVCLRYPIDAYEARGP